MFYDVLPCSMMFYVLRAFLNSFCRSVPPEFHRSFLLPCFWIFVFTICVFLYFDIIMCVVLYSCVVVVWWTNWHTLTVTFTRCATKPNVPTFSISAFQSNLKSHPHTHPPSWTDSLWLCIHPEGKRLWKLYLSLNKAFLPLVHLSFLSNECITMFFV